MREESRLSLNLQAIYAARERLARHIVVSPLQFSASLSDKLEVPLHLKLENWQPTGSFKVRGALNKVSLLSDNNYHGGIITASAGNHALGVAFAASVAGIGGKIVVPREASAAKVAALRHYPLEVISYGRDYDEAEEQAWKLQRESDLSFVHAFNDPHIIVGQGTIGLEIVEQLPDVGTVVVPIGGGGLISGVGLAIKSINPKIKIVGVQSEASPAMYRSLRAGKPVETPIEESLADGLAGRFVSELTLRHTLDYADDVVLVSESSIRDAIMLLLDCEHHLAEGSAVVGLAAIMEGKVDPSGKCVVIITGRNISTELVKTLF